MTVMCRYVVKIQDRWIYGDSTVKEQTVQLKKY